MALIGAGLVTWIRVLVLSAAVTWVVAQALFAAVAMSQPLEFLMEELR
jgi:hypothetical protein